MKRRVLLLFPLCSPFTFVILQLLILFFNILPLCTLQHSKSFKGRLQFLELSYNAAYRSSIQTTPFKVLYDCVPLVLIRYGSPLTPIDAVDCMLSNRDVVLDMLKEKLHHAQLIMKTKAHCQCREIKFEVGSNVYLKLQPYCMHSLAKYRITKSSQLVTLTPFRCWLMWAWCHTI